MILCSTRRTLPVSMSSIENGSREAEIRADTDVAQGLFPSERKRVFGRAEREDRDENRIFSGGNVQL